MDGIDVALLTLDDGGDIGFGPSMAVDYSPAVRRAIEKGLLDAQSIENREDRPGSLAELEALITNLHADAVNRFIETGKLDRRGISAIGFHGQTVLHRPEDGLTVQLGDGDALAAATGIDVIYDMRAADMQAGGQGAPLVPVFHQALAASVHEIGHEARPVAFVNIGGISNITCVGKDDELIAFDTGPGNALIDQWMVTQAGVPMDQGGRVASEGVVISSIAQRYLASPYFESPLPKSLDRGDFAPLAAGEAELSDGARTLAHVTAISIMRACDHLPKPPRLWIICGGGRQNTVIMNELKHAADTLGGKVLVAEDVGLQGDMLEAQAFAYLALLSQDGMPLTFPGTTGCREPVTGGVLAKA